MQQNVRKCAGILFSTIFQNVFVAYFQSLHPAVSIELSIYKYILIPDLAADLLLHTSVPSFVCLFAR